MLRLESVSDLIMRRWLRPRFQTWGSVECFNMKMNAWFASTESPTPLSLHVDVVVFAVLVRDLLKSQQIAIKIHALNAEGI